MDRSFAGRLGIGGVTRPPARANRRPARGRPQRRRPQRPARGRGRGEANGLDLAIAHALRAPAALVRALGAGWTYVRARKRLWLALLATLVALPLLGGGWLWLRDSPLVAVEHVRVSGVHGPDARAIEAMLAEAAKRMSTLDFSEAKLRAAVASYPLVGGLKVRTSFPHGVRIEVVEQPPVAMLSADGANLAVAANGTVLGMAQARESLPALTLPQPGAGQQLTAGGHVRGAALLGALSVLGAVPAKLAAKTERAYSGSKGLTLLLAGGIRAYFGDSSRPHAKWASLARVLADPGSVGASYVDVRVPERPAAGFPPGVTPPAVEGSQSEAEGATAVGSESAQSLEEGLASALGGADSSTPVGATEEASGREGGASAEGGAAGEAQGESREAAAAGSGEGEH